MIRRVQEFKHKVGVHCESSALRDMFDFYGFPMSEAMVFGLDGTFGFSFFDNSNNSTTFRVNSDDFPVFLGGKQGSITPNSLACRLLGIKLRKQSFSSSEKAWEESKKIINQVKPLLLQVDLAYLKYMSKVEEFHFGGHAITLSGYDEEKGVAYVGDTEYEGFQEILINDLKMARSSSFGPSFMRPNNAQYSMEPRPNGKHPPLSAGVKLAIQEAVNHMLRPSTNNVGIQGLKQFRDSILKWRNNFKGMVPNLNDSKEISKARFCFDLMYGSIEEWGTGGAAFRNLFKGFMEEITDLQELKKGPRAWSEGDFNIVNDNISLIISSTQNWTRFARILKKSTDEYEDQCLENIDLKELHDIASEIVNQEELLFNNLTKLKL